MREATKPPAGAKIDWSHPLAAGLILCLPLNEGSGSQINDLVAGRRLTLGGTAVFGPTKRGTGITHPAAAGAIWASISSAAFIPLQNVTILHGVRKRAGNQNSAAFGISPDSAAARCSVSLPFGDGVVYWDFGGTSSGTTRLSVASLTYTDNIWAFSTGARGMEVWQDGIRRGSNTANPTRSATTNAFALGGGSGALVFDQIDGHFFYMWARQLSVEEIRWASAEPFAFLSTPNYRKYFAPAQVAPEVVTVDKWYTTPEPVPADVARLQYLYPYLAQPAREDLGDPPPEEILVEKWFTPTAQPLFDHERLQFLYPFTGAYSIDPLVAGEPEVDVSSWYVPLSQPVIPHPCLDAAHLIPPAWNPNTPVTRSAGMLLTMGVG